MPIWIAHRGYSSQFPENTMVAFEKALETPADMIEFDVTLTKNRKIVVIHDETLDRTTNGSGQVSAYTLEELKELDAGSWFDPQFAAQKIPTLEEVLQWNQGRITLNIEIKPEAYEPNHPEDAIEKQISSLIQKYQCEDQCVISSFQPEALFEVRKFLPKIKIGVLLWGDIHHQMEQILSLATSLEATSIHPHMEYATKPFVQGLQKAKFQVLPYTVNRSHFSAFKEIGADGCFTDMPSDLEQWWTKQENN